MVKAVLVGKAASVVRMVSVKLRLEIVNKLRWIGGDADLLTVRRRTCWVYSSQSPTDRDSR